MSTNTLLKKCPNCGANIEHYYNHKCPYCRTYLHMTDEKIKKINNCDIKVEKIEIERNPLRYGFIITVMGWSTPKFHYIEEQTPYGYIVSGEDVGKRVGYRMELPMEILCKNDFKELQDYIYHCIPPEWCNGYNEEKIIEKCYEQFRNKFF